MAFAAGMLPRELKTKLIRKCPDDQSGRRAGRSRTAVRSFGELVELAAGRVCWRAAAVNFASLPTRCALVRTVYRDG